MMPKATQNGGYGGVWRVPHGMFDLHKICESCPGGARLMQLS
jgi:hypothetical protein